MFQIDLSFFEPWFQRIDGLAWLIIFHPQEEATVAFGAWLVCVHSSLWSPGFPVRFLYPHLTSAGQAEYQHWDTRQSPKSLRLLGVKGTNFNFLTFSHRSLDLICCLWSQKLMKTISKSIFVLLGQSWGRKKKRSVSSVVQLEGEKKKPRNNWPRG